LKDEPDEILFTKDQIFVSTSEIISTESAFDYVIKPVMTEDFDTHEASGHISEISEMDHDGGIASKVATTAAATEKKLAKLKSYKIPKKGVVASLVVAKQVKSKKVSKEVEHEKDDNVDLEQDSDDQVESFSDGEETVKVAEEPKKTQDEGATPASVESVDDEAMPEVPPLTAKQKSDCEKLDLEKKMSKIFGTSSEEDSADNNVENPKPSTSTSIKKRLRQNPSPSKRYICESRFNPVIDLDRTKHIPIVRLNRSDVKSHVTKGRKNLSSHFPQESKPKKIQYEIQRPFSNHSFGKLSSEKTHIENAMDSKAQNDKIG